MRPALLFISCTVCLSMLLFMSFPVQSRADGAAASSRPEKTENLIPGPMVLPQAWPGGETFPAGLTAIMNHFSLAHYKPYKHSSPYTMRAPNGMKVGPEDADQFVNVFKIRYGITDRWEIRTATPYINLDINNHATDGSWKGGLGDTTLMLRYGLVKRSEDSPFSVALDAGVVLPTGKVGDKDKYLATNAFAMILGGGASWIACDQRVDFDARYSWYAEGAHDIKPGDFALFHGHYAYALSRNFDVGVEAYYRVEQESEINGTGQGDAFSEAYAGPKIQVKVPELCYLMVGAAVLFPVYRHYEAMKLATDTRYEFSVLIAF